MKQALILVLLLCNFAAMAQASAASKRWSEKQANEWYQRQPWLVGCNYIPANAINELEMWQAETFDPRTIDKELGWAEGLGMNPLRVFLHDLLWQQDAEGFKKRIDQFLRIADKHKIKPMFVLFDSCWEPFPQSGPQRAPNWGFVAGKTQTFLPWDSWQRPYTGREPAIWFHEIFKQDGTPYRQEEIELIWNLTGKTKPVKANAKSAE
jgi:hypothetical protein